MKIEKDRAVYIEFTLTDDAGELLDTTEGAGPLAYIHGHGNLIPGLETALEGREEGERFSTVVPPGEGYGERVAEAVIEVPRDRLDPDTPLEPGTPLQVQGPEGMIDFTLVEAGEDTAVLDGNHPLAGVELHFDVRVVAVREAHADEIKHGRLHPGGHHLMVEDSSYTGES